MGQHLYFLFLNLNHLRYVNLLLSDIQLHVAINISDTIDLSVLKLMLNNYILVNVNNHGINCLREGNNHSVQQPRP